MQPKVSIILITYNRARFLARALNSALQQTYDNLEIYIMDDASTDNTEAVVQPYLKDERIKYVKNNPNVGFSHNVQKGLMQCIAGEFFLVLSDDDKLIDKNYIREAVSMLRHDNQMQFVFANYEGRNMYTNVLDYRKDYPIPDQIVFKGTDLWKNLIQLQPYWGTCVFRTSSAREKGGFYNSFSGMDVLFMLNIALKGNIGYIKKFILNMGTNGVTVGIHQSLDLQYENMDFIREAAILAQYQKSIDFDIEKWKKINLTHLITLMFRDYVFKHNEKSIEDKVMELYEKAMIHGDEKYLILAQAQWLQRLVNK